MPKFDNKIERKIGKMELGEGEEDYLEELKDRKMFEPLKNFLLNEYYYVYDNDYESDDDNDYETVNDLLDRFNISREYASSLEFRALINKIYLELLARDRFSFAENIKDAFRLSEVESSEEEKLVWAGFQKMLANGNLFEAKRLKEYYNLSDAKVQKEIKDLVTDQIASDKLQSALDICESFVVPDKFLRSPEVTLPMSEEFKKNIAVVENCDQAIKIFKIFKLPQEFLQSSDVSGLIENAFKKLLLSNEYHKAIRIKKELGVPEEFIQSPEVSNLIENIFKEAISFRDLSVLEIKKELGVSEKFLNSPDTNKMIKEWFKKILTTNYYLEGVKKELNLSEDFINSQEISDKIKAKFLTLLNTRHLIEADKLAQEFNLFDEFLQTNEVTKNLYECIDNDFSNYNYNVVNKLSKTGKLYRKAIQVLIKLHKDYLNIGRPQYAMQIEKNYKLADNIYNQNREEEFSNTLKKGYINTALMIKKNSEFSIDFLQSYEIKKDIEDAFIKLLSNSNYQDINIMLNSFPLSDEFLNSNRVRIAFKDMLSKKIFKNNYSGGGNNFENLNHLKKRLNISETFIQTTVEEACTVALQDKNKTVIDFIINNFNLSEKFLNEPNIVTLIKEFLAIYLIYNDFKLFKELCSKLALSQELINDTIIEAIKREIEKDHINKALEIKSLLDPEGLLYTEIQQQAEKSFIRNIKKLDFEASIFIKENFNLTDEFINSSEVIDEIQKSFLESLQQRKIKTSIKIRQQFNLSEDFLNSPDIRQKIEKTFELILNANKYEEVLMMQKKFKLDDSFLESNDIHEAIERNFRTALLDGDYERVVAFKKTFNLTEIFSDNKACESLEIGMKNALSKASYQQKISEIKKLNLPDEVIKTAAEKSFTEVIMSLGNYERASKIREEFDLTEEFITSRTTMEVISNALKVSMLIKNIDQVKYAQREFDLPIELVDAIAQKAFIKCLLPLSPDIETALVIKRELKLAEDFLSAKVTQDAIQTAFKTKLSSYQLGSAILIKKELGLSNEFLNSPDTHKLVEESLLQALKEGSNYKYIPIFQQEFNLSDEFITDIIHDTFKKFISECNFISAIEIKKVFHLSEDFIKSDEVMQNIRTALKRTLLSNNKLHYIIEELKLPDEYYKELIEESFKEAQKLSNYKTALAINKAFDLSDEFLNSFEILNRTREAFVEALYSNNSNFEEAIRIKNEFNLP